MPQDYAKTLAAQCGCGEKVETDSDGDGAPVAPTSAPKTLTNRFPVRVAAEKKQKQTLIATVFPIASTNAPKTAKRRRPVCVVVE
jgi:hypothetical protein